MNPSIIMWNRLEPVSQNENQMENALRFEVRDALWMLTRQWQFGELDGEDAGTAAFCRVKYNMSPVQMAGSRDSSPQPFDFQRSPLGLPIEQENFAPDISFCLEMGRHWRRLLSRHLPANKVKTIFEKFKKHEGLGFAKLAEDSLSGKLVKAHLLADESRQQLLETISDGRMLNGYALYLELKSGKKASSLINQANSEIDNAGGQFVQWFDQSFNRPDSTSNAWHSQHLEYQPQFAFADADNKPHIIQKEEYYGEGVEWYGYNAKNNWNETDQLSTNPDAVASDELVAIPSNVHFRGMPSTRLWEMEDAKVDFGSIQASSTELSKMLFAEFGLVYGNDWLIVPVKLRYGCLCRIKAIQMMDIFGKDSSLREIAPNPDWAFFQTQTLETEGHWLFLANDAEFIQESAPLEKVSFLKDEMANIVWGVETIISNPKGGGRDGNQLAKQVTQWLASISDSGIQDQTPIGTYAYRLSSQLSENSIPFIPVVTPNPEERRFSKRKVVLQRAAMPRTLSDLTPVRIRPRTNLLGTGEINDQNKILPFYIFEDEIPSTGIELQLRWKRVRWINGTFLTWLTRLKTIGRGEIDSNLQFDMLKKKE